MVTCTPATSSTGTCTWIHWTNRPDGDTIKLTISRLDTRSGDVLKRLELEVRVRGWRLELEVGG